MTTFQRQMTCSVWKIDDYCHVMTSTLKLFDFYVSVVVCCYCCVVLVVFFFLTETRGTGAPFNCELVERFLITLSSTTLSIETSPYNGTTTAHLNAAVTWVLTMLVRLWFQAPPLPPPHPTPPPTHLWDSDPSHALSCLEMPLR